MEIILSRELGEFLVVYDELCNELATLQSDELDTLYENICNMLDHFGIKYTNIDDYYLILKSKSKK